MTAESCDIARRLVACSMFRWAPGMLIREWSDGRCPSRLMLLDESGRWHAFEPTIGTWLRFEPGRLAETCSAPELDDPATGGALLVALGHEAARVRYSPSLHKQAAGTPWLADLFGSSCNSSLTMHATLGRACAAVMIELSGRAT